MKDDASPPVCAPADARLPRLVFTGDYKIKLSGKTGTVFHQHHGTAIRQVLHGARIRAITAIEIDIASLEHPTSLAGAFLGKPCL